MPQRAHVRIRPPRRVPYADRTAHPHTEPFLAAPGTETKKTRHCGCSPSWRLRPRRLQATCLRE
eukprot:5702216-Prorocentrum_lima.AAC.1